jgi:hypothetical protein
MSLFAALLLTIAIAAILLAFITRQTKSKKLFSVRFSSSCECCLSGNIKALTFYFYFLLERNFSQITKTDLRSIS